MSYMTRLDQDTYDRFMKSLAPFIEGVPQGMNIASALDAFFFEYGGTHGD